MTGGRSEGMRRAARRWIVVGLGCLAMHLAAPRPAFALFEWLDHLSGPGPFRGAEFQFRILCAMDQATPEDAERAAREANEALERLIRSATIKSPKVTENIDFSSTELQRQLTTLQKELPTVSAIGATPSKRLPLPPALQLELQRMGDYAQVLATAFSVVGQMAKDEKEEVLELQINRAAQSLKRAADIGYEARVEPLRKKPGLSLWASCYDGPSPRNSLTGAAIRRAQYDRPSFSLNANYRFYTTKGWLGLRNTSRQEYADGRNIWLHMWQAQLSFPLTGRADIIDGQTSAGIYRFDSAAVNFDSFTGLVVEPIRFDLHVPARFMTKTAKWYLRAPQSLSLRWGLVMFPGGIEATEFKASGSAEGKNVAGSEAMFDWGIVLNINRLIWKD
jgi:hypothetical protein